MHINLKSYTSSFVDGEEKVETKKFPVQTCTKDYFKSKYEKKFFDYYGGNDPKTPSIFQCADDPEIYL